MAEEIQWRTDWNEAQQEARQRNLPLLLEFYMDGCPHCARLHRETHEEAQVIEAVTSRFVPVRLEGRHHIELVRKLGVRGAPTTLIFSPDGKELHRFAGFHPPEEYLRELEKIR